MSNDALREALQIGLAYTRGAVHELREEGASQSEIDEANDDVRKIEAALAGLPEDGAKEIYTPRCKSCVLRTECNNPNNPLCSSWAPKEADQTPQAQPYNQFGTDY